MEKISEITDFLTILGLPTTKLPTVQEVRKKYKALLIYHPDRAGPATTAEFQKITEAVRNILDTLQKCPRQSGEDETPTESEDDSGLLSAMEEAGGMRKNKDDSVTIILEEKDCPAWLNQLEKKLGPRTRLGDGCSESYQFKMNDWKIPYVTVKTNVTYGSVSVSVWVAPKSGPSKARIQGSAGVAFVIFEVPKILKVVRTNMLESLEEEEDESLTINNTVQPTAMQTQNDTPLLGAFHKMEVEMVNLKTTMSNKVDQLTAQVGSHTAYENKLSNLETAVSEQSTQISEIKTTLDNLLASNTTLKTTADNISQQNTTIVTTLNKVQQSSAKNGENLTQVSNNVTELSQLVRKVQTDVTEIKTDNKSQLGKLIESNNKNNQELVEIRRGIEALVAKFPGTENSQKKPEEVVRPSNVDNNVKDCLLYTSPSPRDS